MAENAENLRDTLARSMQPDVDWSRFGQPFGELKDTNPVLHTLPGGREIRQDDVDRATGMAMGFSGGGLSTKGIKAYHSSPHDFERFDLSKVGTGEGAQVYGHGIYAAENPAVSGQGGQYWNSFANRFGGSEGSATEYLRRAGFDRAKAMENLNREINVAIDNGHTSTAWMLDRTKALQLLESGRPVGPRTYELGIKADPDALLNWDKTIEQQPGIWDRIPANTRSHIDELYDQRGFNSISDAPEAYTGKDLYKALAHHEVSEGFPSFHGENWDNARANASAFLDQVAGIPGIKYLDEGSRALAARANNPNNANWLADSAAFKATPPTSNYVSFNPARDIDIYKKYGIAGVPVAGVAAASASGGGDREEKM
jgi:hypothetical protein